MPTTTKYGHLGKIDPGFKAIQSAVDEGMKQLWALPLDQIRTALRQPPQLPEDIPKDLIIKDETAPVRDGTRIGIRIYRAKDTPDNALLFYSIHGGGWVVAGHEAEEIVNRSVAAQNKAVVISVDYRMAPEFRYPYAVNDCFDVLKWCKQNAAKLGINPERIIVGGSSAGGNLSAVTALKARDEGVSGIIGQVLNIPVTCHPQFFPKEKYEYTSWEQNKNASLLDADRMMWFWNHYLPTPVPEPYASPLLAKSLSGLPPALVQVGGMDPLRDEGIAYSDALKAAGVPVQLELYSGMPHGFGAMPPLKDAVREYTQTVVKWIRDVSTSVKANL